MARSTAFLVVLLAIVPLLGLLPATALTSAPPALTFADKGGNSWWVEAVVGGADSPLVARVQARDSYGPWVDLAHEPWGTWGGSFLIEPGHLVQFQATLTDGRTALSCAFAHPAGMPMCGTPLEPNATALAFAATFQPSNGNAWWVQTGVAANAAVASVCASVNGGACVALANHTYGWASSFYVATGANVVFRATSTGGAVATSPAYVWPTGALATSPAPAPAPAPAPSPAPAASLAVQAKLAATNFVQGATMSGTVTVTSSVDATLARVVLAARPPGGTNAGGPFLDVGATGPVSVKAGVPTTLSFSRAVTTSDPVGSWYAFGTAQTADGVWHDGPSVAFSVVAPAPAPAPVPAPTPTPAPAPAPGPVAFAHTNIVSTTFWVGEIFNANLADGSQVCSTYDSAWAFHWSGVNNGVVPASAAGCAGSIVGGCDGVPGANNACATEKRTAANGYFPTSPLVHPKENPFYLDLPFDDVNDPIAYAERCQVIPWASQPGFAGHCADPSFSYMKNHWVAIKGPNGNVCYGQVEDAGPSHGTLYHDANYVFGTTNAQPVQGQFNNAGMDVSPALNGCLGFAELDGQNDHVSWSFVDASQVPAGPWKTIVTASQVTP